jgi:hypothetical protein
MHMSQLKFRDNNNKATRCGHNRGLEMGAPLLPPERGSMKEANKKTKLVKLRVTPNEQKALSELAREEGGVSALIRRRVLGRQSVRPPAKTDVLLLARIHSSLQQIARSLSTAENRLSLVQVLAQLWTIEQRLDQLLTHISM